MARDTETIEVGAAKALATLYKLLNCKLVDIKVVMWKDSMV